MTESDWIQDIPILLNDPFTMNFAEITNVPELLLPESPEQTTNKPETEIETEIEIHTETEIETETIRGHQKIPSEPERKRKVGRPLKTEARPVTVLPTGRVSRQTLREARYRRMRDLNNIASSKARLKR